MTDILIIEDNKDLAFGIKNNLEIEGYQVECVTDGQKGLDKLKVLQPDSYPQVILLDLMMPNMDGFEFLKQLQNLPDKPMVLVLSARDTEVDKVTGLRLGADDFLTKPFGLMELLARIEALIRRRHPETSIDKQPQVKTIKIDRLLINLTSRQVFLSEKEIELAPKEFDLLAELMSHPGEVISRLDLMSRVWGYSAAVESRTVDTHIGELRKKLEKEPANPEIIKTVRKMGYRIDRGNKTQGL